MILFYVVYFFTNFTTNSQLLTQRLWEFIRNTYFLCPIKIIIRRFGVLLILTKLWEWISQRKWIENDNAKWLAITSDQQKKLDLPNLIYVRKRKLKKDFLCPFFLAEAGSRGSKG